jgi:hypothetical protein
MAMYKNILNQICNGIMIGDDLDFEGHLKLWVFAQGTAIW